MTWEKPIVKDVQFCGNCCECGQPFAVIVKRKPKTLVCSNCLAAIAKYSRDGDDVRATNLRARPILNAHTRQIIGFNNLPAPGIVALKVLEHIRTCEHCGPNGICVQRGAVLAQAYLQAGGSDDNLKQMFKEGGIKDGQN